MANGILIRNNPLLPAIGQLPDSNIVSCTEIFRCHEYKFGRNIVMYTGSKVSGVYVVSYNSTPDVSGGVDRRWLYYSSNEYNISLGSDLEGSGEYYNENSEHHTNYYYGTIGSQLGVVSDLIYNSNIYNYDSLGEALAGEGIIPYGVYPITYRLTNCTSPNAPTEAGVGDNVNVSFRFPDGYGFPNPATDVYVYNNGVLVPSTYANNTLTFTMPDPS